MADILLTHSYFLRFDHKQWKAQQPFPPLATLYAASVLRNNGYNIVLHDMMFARSANEIKTSLKKNSSRFFIIYDDGFNYLTKMCLTNMREAAFEMIHIAKENGCTIIISSSDATDHSAEYLEKGADFIIAGEGEQTLLELIQALEVQSTFESIAGLRYIQNDQLIQTHKRERLKRIRYTSFSGLGSG